MKNEEEKLKAFSDMALRAAIMQKQEILNEIKEQVNQLQTKITKETLKKAEQNLKLETEKAVRKRNEEISKVNLENKKLIIEKRKELISRMYENVRKKILEFTKTTDYENWIVKQILAAKELLMGENIVVYISEKDSALKDTIAQKANVKVEIDEDIFLGGCKTVNLDRRTLVDDTLQKRLEEVFSKFQGLTSQKMEE